MAEAAGTLIFVWAVLGASFPAGPKEVLPSPLQPALAAGLVAISLAHCFGDISGAQVNPALTVAFLCTRKLDAVHAVSYILAQCLGAIIASSVFYLMLPTSAIRQMVTKVSKLHYFLPMEGTKEDNKEEQWALGRLARRGDNHHGKGERRQNSGWFRLSLQPQRTVIPRKSPKLDILPLQEGKLIPFWSVSGLGISRQINCVHGVKPRWRVTPCFTLTLLALTHWGCEEAIICVLPPAPTNGVNKPLCSMLTHALSLFSSPLER